ncbi:carbohydrate kinase family protein [bacterium]|nr:carbohydrate kinase family protein [bacterium]
MPEVTCVGILVADIVAQPVERYPEKGRLVLVDTIELHTGGCASNTGVSLAKIGVDTAVVGKVGKDAFGDFVINSLNKHGVNTRGIKRDDKALTSATQVFVHPDGERSFIHYIGANANFTEEDIDDTCLEGTRIVHYAGFYVLSSFDGEPCARFLQRAKNLGAFVSLDTVWDSQGRWMSLIEPVLPHLDLIIPSIEEAKMITGKEKPREIAKVFLDKGVGMVALKMGSKGSYVRTKDEEIYMPRFEVKAIDAVGAGDAFVAGFLTGLLKGWDLEMTTKFANAVGALCVTAIGATTGVRSFQETLQFMHSTPLAKESIDLG